MDATGPAGLRVGELRRARRAFVLAQHPDRGGDPAAFAAGLAHFALLLDLAGPVPATRPGAAADPLGAGTHGPPAAAPPRVVIVRRARGSAGWLRRLTRALTRGRHPGRHLR